jgi:urease accessory protein
VTTGPKRYASLHAAPLHASPLHAAQVEAQGWKASIALRFAAAQQQTFLASSRHEGPLYVQRTFVDPVGTCQAYLLHPPGGIVGGDQLRVEVLVEAGAQALLTSPGATKFYRSTGQESQLLQSIRVEAGASFEWLPQDAIVFSGAIARSVAKVELASGARFAAWEVVSLGRPAAAERFVDGCFRQSFELWLDGEPLWVDRAMYRGGDPLLDARYGLAGCPVLGSFVLYPATREDLAAARGSGVSEMAFTLVEQVLVCRIVGPSTFLAREAFVKVWHSVRPRILGKAAHAPRIWAT